MQDACLIWLLCRLISRNCLLLLLFFSLSLSLLLLFLPLSSLAASRTSRLLYLAASAQRSTSSRPSPLHHRHATYP